MPALTRKDSELSDLEFEKAGTQHLDHPGTITEEDEGGNVGLAAYHESQRMAEITPAQNKAILRRIDWFLLPLMLILQTTQYLDKTALNYANVFGMKKALHLTGNQYSLAASMFYVGYLVAQPFFSYMMGRWPAGRVLGISCVLWGVSVLTIVANKNFAHVMVNRFFLGALEAGVTPGLSLMTGFFYTRKEIPLRQMIWYSAIGWGGIIGSLMAAGIQGLSDDGPVKRWQLIFYILGSFTIALGIFLCFFLADGPSNAPWLKKEFRPLAVARVAANGTGIKSTQFDRAQAVEALFSLKAWLITIAMFGSSVPNGILTNFSGPLITAMGFSQLNAALLDCAGRSLQIISLLIAGWIATKYDNQRILMATAGNVICVFGSCMMSFLPFEQTWGRLAGGLWLINVQSVGFTLGLVMISSNMGGYTKRAVTSSMVFCAYCVGNIVGPLCVFESEAPEYRSASYAMLAGYIAKLICHLLLGWYMLAQNRKRDRENGPADVKKAAELGMRNVTEKSNPDFRYVL